MRNHLGPTRAIPIQQRVFPSPISVAVVEDDDALLEGLAVLINGTSGFRCVSACSSAEAALIEIPVQEVDVVLMDIYLPKMNGLDCTTELLRRKPDLLIIIHTWFEEDSLVFGALRSGASGFLTKETPPAKLLEGIEQVLRGGAPMSNQVGRKVIRAFRGNLRWPHCQVTKQDLRPGFGT